MDLYDIRRQLMSGKTIFDLNLNVTYYARVSTEKDEQLHSLDAQIRYFDEFIRSMSNWKCIDGYYDEGITGTSANKRDQFLRMIEDARLGKFDFIVTKEISRFSRNTLDSIHYTQELLRYGVGVYFQSDNINTLDPDAELRLTIMASIAQDEIRKLSERTKFGFKRSIEKGVVLGSDCIWGYKKDKGSLVVLEEEAAIVRKIFDMYAMQNMGVRSISQALAEQGIRNRNGHAFAYTTLRNIIANPKYKGYYCGNKTHKVDYKLNTVKRLEQEEWVMYKDEENVPAIVSEEIWEKANRILAARSEKQSTTNTSYQNKYSYSGKIICGDCGVPYYRTCYHYKNGDRELWQCRNYYTKGKAGCSTPVVYTNELDDILSGIIQEIKIDKAKIINDLIKMYSELLQSTNITRDCAKAQVDIDEIMMRKDKLLDLSINGKITDDEFERRNNRFNAEIESLQATITKLKADEEKSRALTQSVSTLRDIISDQLDFHSPLPENLVDTLLEKVVVRKTGDRHFLRLEIYLKVNDAPKTFEIRRGRGTSVCTPLST